MYLAKIIAQGCPEISDGREFIVECRDGDGGKPYDYEAPGPLEWTEPDIKVLGIVSWNVRLICPDCKEICAKRTLLLHTASWMFTAFYCQNHLKNLFLDIFPKTSTYDTGWDYTNAFAADIDPISNPDLPKGVEIKNRQGPGERYTIYKNQLANTPIYILTPGGVKNPPILEQKINQTKSVLYKLQQKFQQVFAK